MIKAHIYVEYLAGSGAEGISCLIEPEKIEPVTRTEAGMWHLFSIAFERGQARIMAQMLAHNCTRANAASIDTTSTTTVEGLKESIRARGGLTHLTAVLGITAPEGDEELGLFALKGSPSIQAHPLVLSCWHTMHAAICAAGGQFENLSYTDWDEDCRAVAEAVDEAIDPLPVFPEWKEGEV